MSENKDTTLAPARGARDPFAMLRQMASELDRAFEDWPSSRWMSFGQPATSSPSSGPRRLTSSCATTAWSHAWTCRA